MRILLDECVPRPLRRQFSEHEVRTVGEMGWAGLKNGVLLRLAVSAGFDLFLTSDQNLRYQQNLPAIGIALIVMIATSNRLNDLLPLVPQVQDLLLEIRPGEVREVDLG